MTERYGAQVLVVERDPQTGKKVLAYLRDQAYDVEWVDDGEKAFNRLDAHAFDVMVTELNIHRVDGLRLMGVARERNPDICVVFTTQRPDMELATEAMRQGAYDFQIKPLNLDKLDAVLQRGIAYQRLVFEQVELKRRLDARFGLGNLVGRSRQMVQVYTVVREIGPTDETILIHGEPGTGKDLIAEAIHNSSARRDEAFVKMGCAGIPDAVVERELFGDADAQRRHVPGARAPQCRFELADKGTLFLDGIEELSPALQERLLGVLEQGAFERARDGKSIPVDVRIIGAIGQRPDHLERAGLFLPRLRGRIGRVTIEAPALRERREDIPLLVTRAFRETADELGRPPLGITRNAMNLLIRYEWPGNVRELLNVVEGMAVSACPSMNAAGRKPSSGEAVPMRPLDVQDIPEYVRRSAAPEAGEIRIPTGASMSAVERIAIEETMKMSGYNKEKCAKTLGIGLRTLYRKLKEYAIR